MGLLLCFIDSCIPWQLDKRHAVCHHVLGNQHIASGCLSILCNALEQLPICC